MALIPPAQCRSWCAGSEAATLRMYVISEVARSRLAAAQFGRARIQGIDPPQLGSPASVDVRIQNRSKARQFGAYEMEGDPTRTCVQLGISQGISWPQLPDSTAD